MTVFVLISVEGEEHAIDFALHQHLWGVYATLDAAKDAAYGSITSKCPELEWKQDLTKDNDGCNTWVSQPHDFDNIGIEPSHFSIREMGIEE